MMMIPARYTCPSNWTREYYGYLMANHKERYRNMFTCVDKNPEAVPGRAGGHGTNYFYHVEASCNGMPCPPYDPQKELACVVCTK